jgi:hypothetical protein
VVHHTAERFTEVAGLVTKGELYSVVCVWLVGTVRLWESCSKFDVTFMESWRLAG